MKNETRRVLFLDFDGVMITEFGTQVRETLGSTEDEFGPMFDPTAENALQDLEKKVSFDIVVTSNRRFVGLETLQAMWKKRKLGGNLYDITPLHAADQAIAEGEKDPCNIKAIEIKSWLAQHPEVGLYVIVDDEPIEDIELKANVVLCHSNFGLAEKYYTIVSAFRGVLHKPLEAPNDFGLFNLRSCEQLRTASRKKLLYKDFAQLPKIPIKQSKGIVGWFARTFLKKKVFYITELDSSIDEFGSFMAKVMENVLRIIKSGNEQVALAYGLAMLITMQTNAYFKYCRYHEFIGLLCEIAVGLKEVEMAKMLIRIMEGSHFLESLYTDFTKVDERFFELEEKIHLIPESEVKDNRLLYFELICELRRHWYNEKDFILDDFLC